MRRRPLRSRKKERRLLLKQVDDAERFGVVAFDGEKISEIIEKPKNPPSNHAVTGVYFYDAEVLEFIKRLEPSDRGELEITDVNNMYLRGGNLEFDVVKGWWTDAGTFSSLHRAANLVAETERKTARDQK